AKGNAWIATHNIVAGIAAAIQFHQGRAGQRDGTIDNGKRGNGRTAAGGDGPAGEHGYIAADRAGPSQCAAGGNSHDTCANSAVYSQGAIADRSRTSIGIGGGKGEGPGPFLNQAAVEGGTEGSIVLERFEHRDGVSIGINDGASGLDDARNGDGGRGGVGL